MPNVQCSVTASGQLYLLDSSGQRLPGNPTVTIGVGSIIDADQQSLTPPVPVGPAEIFAPNHVYIVTNTDPSGGAGQFGEVQTKVRVNAQ